MSNYLPYDPGSPPTHPAPARGETIVLKLSGLPPTKDRRQSIRNQKHPRHSTFTALRKSAEVAMAGRACYFGPVELHLTCTYKLPIFYPLCFDIHASDGGCRGCLPSCQRVDVQTFGRADVPTFRRSDKSRSAIIPPRSPGGALAALRPSLI